MVSSNVSEIQTYSPKSQSMDDADNDAASCEIQQVAVFALGNAPVGICTSFGVLPKAFANTSTVLVDVPAKAVVAAGAAVPSAVALASARDVGAFIFPGFSLAVE